MATLAEMLEEALTLGVTNMSIDAAHSFVRVGAWRGSEVRGYYHGGGATLQEALAALLVDVKRPRGKAIKASTIFEDLL